MFAKIRGDTNPWKDTNWDARHLFRESGLRQNFNPGVDWSRGLHKCMPNSMH